ncbi:hypothetical protein GXN76_04480 [Kroppenstedtia pulmonis]|uniref:Protein argonaute n=1 Tax=Kroppenstedtia pulmonis TaxID=1380685 RepID=A0A7D3XHP2_9BACL|nr:Piwi domain-containing protein [Kroppenstedtia pulmonis]QKG83804.1 hypothetical protein GXN76_04480 [Kroppenstedtia pulmonis]
MEQFFLSELFLDTRSNQIPLYFYHVPVLDLEKIDQYHYKTLRLLEKQNPDQTIHFYRHLIGSFHPIKYWGEMGDQTLVHRPIKTNIIEERKLLERLLIKNIEQAQNRDHFYTYRGRITKKKPETSSTILSFRYLTLHTTIDHTSRISIGFNMGHTLLHKMNLYQLLQEKTNILHEGMEVFDPYNRSTYKFIGQSQATVSDPILPGNQSILEYLRQQGRTNLKIPQNTPAVTVESKGRSKKQFHFAPQLLKLICSFDQVSIPQQIQQQIKLNAHKRTEMMRKFVEHVLSNWQNKAPFPVSFSMNSTQPKQHGYHIKQFKDPFLLFGRGFTTQDQKNGLKQGGSYTRPAQKVKYQYLIQPEIIDRLVNQKNHFQFAKSLEQQSSKWGVELDIHKTGRKELDFSNSTKLRDSLKEIAPTLQYPTVVIIDEQYRTNKAIYRIIKQECGREKNIPTQVVYLDTTHNKYAYANILLGLYAKAGIQPWILKKPLHSPCFIGLDVSRDDGKHSTGVVQAVGQDGRILFAQSLTSTERGEIISEDSLQQIISTIRYHYNKEFGHNPPHITFHRDGRGYEGELRAITRVMNEMGIPFDYISVVKNCQRRMALYNEKQGKYRNALGYTYIKDNFAYLCTTNPRDALGMARPIKIEQQYGHLTMDQVLEDIYHLTFMNTHSTLRPRLPVTVNYADKSSTYYNRGLLPLGESNGLPFV